MALKSRMNALLALCLWGGLLEFEWILRASAGKLHPIVLLVACAGASLSLTGMVAPSATKLDAYGTLSPLAHKIVLVGFTIGGALYLALR